MTDKQMVKTILVAGATGNLGGRIIQELVKCGAEVRALVRPGSDAKKVAKLKEQGVQIVEADTSDVAQLTKACEGVACVVSALQGLRDVIVDTQSKLLDAAVTAGVPRFISSDFATDFTKQAAGENRNFDLRKEFMAYIDTKPIAATSIMNGAFAEILFYGTPLLDFKNSQVGYWENADWRIDFTTMDNTAAYTAAAALDDSTPRILRIASFQLSPNELAGVAEEVTHQKYHLARMGSLEDLAAYNKKERAAHPEGEQDVYPRWQQSQYQQSMFTVQHEKLDNDRYPDVKWTSPEEWLARR
jgi:NAD(P)-dependent dehydrogenase (short-subunit alcohol dehydrogenase family)